MAWGMIELSALSKRAETAARAAVARIGDDIRAESDAAAPVRTGALIASGRVELRGTKVVVGYGAPYAHIRHERGRRAGYLERAVARPETLQAMARYFAEELGM